VGLSIKLKRLGSNQKPFFRVVVCDSQVPPKGQALEGIGSYDPLAKDKPLRIDTARAAEWRRRGATVSSSVARLLKRAAEPQKA
jgi:small subunit ribosomal protein S16